MLDSALHRRLLRASQRSRARPAIPEESDHHLPGVDGEHLRRREHLRGEPAGQPRCTATESFAPYDLRHVPRPEAGRWPGSSSTQCGIPLKSELLVVGLNSNTEGEDRSQHYLPGATCLGDVLADARLHERLRRRCPGALRRQGHLPVRPRLHVKIHGLDDWLAEGDDKTDVSAWGLSDARMFAHAEDTRRRPAQGRSSVQPDACSRSTPTTRVRSTRPAPSDDAVVMATALKCSGRAVAGFLDYLKDHGYLDDTVVVLMGDHLKNTGDSDNFRTELDSAPNRTIFFRVWNPDGVQFGREGRRPALRPAHDPGTARFRAARRTRGDRRLLRRRPRPHPAPRSPCRP